MLNEIVPNLVIPPPTPEIALVVGTRVRSTLSGYKGIITDITGDFATVTYEQLGERHGQPLRDLVAIQKPFKNKFSLAAYKNSVKSDSSKNLLAETLQSHPGITCDALEELTGIPHQTASSALKNFKDAGLVYVHGQGITRFGQPAGLNFWHDYVATAAATA